MEFSFTPSPDVSVALNALLDILERRHSRNPALRRDEVAFNPLHQTQPRQSFPPSLLFPNRPNTASYRQRTTQHPRKKRTSQTCMASRRNRPHLLQTITLTEHATRSTALFHLLARTPLAGNRTRLESLLLADKFRFQDDWRARAISYILNQLKAEKSPAPFSLTDSNLNSDLLAVLQAVSTLTTETPYRVFSVRVLNDSKRFEGIKNQFVTLARIGNPEWKRIPAEEVLREVNLVANPSYIHLSGDWQFTTDNGEILNLGGFTPSIGFPAAQISSLRSCTGRIRPLHRKPHHLPPIYPASRQVHR
jgi:hypothetical protein